MKKLILATNNQGKVREMKAIMAGIYDEVVSLRDEGIDIHVEEDADTFLGNAEKKALAISALAGDADVIADDSGLCVEGLGGRPGVYSARYSQAGTDEANNDKLISEVTLLEPAARRAKYVAAMVLARHGAAVFRCEGECHGEILTERQGSGGFGYDPLFFLPEYGQTFGVLPPEEKNKISHRAKALAQVKAFLEAE